MNFYEHIKEYEAEVRNEAYNQGLNDAWELARKIFTLNRTALNNAFRLYEKRSVLDELDVQTALAKLKAYEESQNKIEVGNVVKSKVTDSFVLLVLEIHNDVFTGFDGKETHRCMVIDNFKKTNKHIDIERLLAAIRKE